MITLERSKVVTVLYFEVFSHVVIIGFHELIEMSITSRNYIHKIDIMF